MKNVYPKAGVLIVILLLGSAAVSAQADEAKSADGSIKVASVIPISDAADVRDAVRKECDLGGKLSGFIKQFGSNYDLNIEQTTDTGSEQGKFLHVEIINVQGAGGGAWSGPKSVAIEGSLTENGKEVGTFHASRHSGGGAFSGFKSTCAIFGRDVKALGRDVAKWLKSPTMNASLGDG